MCIRDSTWSVWEPEDGRFEFAWMDRIIERLARAHIHVIMGTPTYSIPPWMFKAHPEILVTRLDGQKATYGTVSYTHLDVYKRQAEAVP